MQYSINVPDPCNESWEHMIPNDKGRHCEQCSKTVIDFTAWEPDAILLYLQAQGTGSTCGRFRKSQLGQHDTQSFIYTVGTAPAPFYSKWLAIFLLAFGMIQMSCNTEIPVTQPQIQGESTVVAPPPVTDSVKKQGARMPEFTAPVIKEEKDTIKKKHKKARTHQTTVPQEEILQGAAMPYIPPMDTGVIKRD